MSLQFCLKVARESSSIIWISSSLWGVPLSQLLEYENGLFAEQVKASYSQAHDAPDSMSRSWRLGPRFVRTSRVRRSALRCDFIEWFY